MLESGSSLSQVSSFSTNVRLPLGLGLGLGNPSKSSLGLSESLLSAVHVGQQIKVVVEEVQLGHVDQSLGLGVVELLVVS